MAFTILDGPLGLEATHALNGVTINQQGVLPRYTLDKVTGLHDSSDANDPRDQLTNQIGEVAYPSLRRGKTVAYTGLIIAASLQDMRAAATTLRRAASSLADTTLAIAPHPTIGGPTLTGYGRPSSYVSDDEQTQPAQAVPSAYQRAFVLSFRLRDPRFFDLADPVTVGAAAGTAASATVPGAAPTEPVFTVNGPTSAAIVLENLTLSKTLQFTTDLTLAGGDVLTVDFLGRQARVGSLDVAGYIDWDNSNWFDEDAIGLDPGVAQNLRVSGAGAWSMSANPAVW